MARDFPPVDVDHDAEAAEQARIAQQVPAEENQPAVSESSVAGETADQPDAAAAADADDIVTVKLVSGAEVDGEPVEHLRIAGVEVTPEGTEVTRATALLLADYPDVEVSD